MGLLVLLIPTEGAEVPMGAASIEALARLGVTSVSLATDDETTAIILEGWAFDAASPSAAVLALGGRVEETRTLQPIVQMAVSPASEQPGTNPIVSSPMPDGKEAF